MAIINPLPYTIANGNPVDATPVESNFSQIVSNVNANAALVGGNASQEFLVATTANPAGAIPLAQANGAYAPIAGNSSQVFAVASGTGADAVPYTQLQSYVSANAAPVNGSTGNVFNVAAATAATNAVQASQTIGAFVSGETAYTRPSRAINTEYVNNSGRPLWVVVVVNVTANNGFYLQSWDGTVVYDFVYTTASIICLKGIIPIGASYSISGGNSIVSWTEY